MKLTATVAIRLNEGATGPTFVRFIRFDSGATETEGKKNYLAALAEVKKEFPQFRSVRVGCICQDLSHMVQVDGIDIVEPPEAEEA